MNGDLHLDSLLRALRTAGLRVGISEVLRLRQIFASQPGLAGGEIPRERLQSLLRAVLVKSAEDRGTFDRICDSWLDRADVELRGARLQPVLVSLPPPISPEVRRGFRWMRVLRQCATATVLALLLFTVDKDTRNFGAVSNQPSRPPGEGKSLFPLAPADIGYGFLLLPPEVGLAVLGWLYAGGLWLALRRRHLLPEPEPLAPAAGPLRAYPLPVAPMGAVLLSPRDQDGLAWGIGRFVAEESSRRLDLSATVRATARAGGLPEMRFHRARFYREVWLWVDEEAADPALPRLADEIEAVLASHGLPVERAAFRGIPYRLVTATGQVFAPNEIDERRDVALVAILTDGRRLVRRWATDDQRVRIDTLLRSLSHWPHLAFVDSSQGDLAAILDRHDIMAIASECATAFLGGTELPRTPPTSAGRLDQGGEAAWAAACALCPSSVDEVTALELRHQLGLAVSPYSLQALRTEAPGPPGRLVWRAADRIRRLSWLSEAEAHSAGAVMPESLLDRALAFWECVYDQTLAQLTERTGDGEYSETAAERFLRMERALLGLWRKPGDHVAELYQLYQGPLRETIRQHCEALAPADWGGAGLIHLPWAWLERTPVERACLREMRFGGGMPPPRRSGRVWLGIGLLVGLGLAAAGVVSKRWDETIQMLSLVGQLKQLEPDRGRPPDLTVSCPARAVECFDRFQAQMGYRGNANLYELVATHVCSISVQDLDEQKSVVYVLRCWFDK